MEFLNSCCEGDKPSLKVTLIVMSSQKNLVWVILWFCRKESGTKSEQIQATAEHKPELHQKIVTGPIPVY